MKTVLTPVLALALAFAGCDRAASWPAVDGTQRTQTAPAPKPDFASASSENPSTSTPLGSGAANSGVNDSPQVVTALKPVELFLEGTVFPSGWMGDAEFQTGPLSFELSHEDPFSGPTCEKWTYRASSASEQGWIGVAYQGPTENNWGDKPGLNLSRRGYRVLTFMARGQDGGERLQVRSGDCTRPGAPFPASHDVSGGVILLTTKWQRFSIELQDADLSNVCAVFAFTVNRAMAPNGCTFFLDDLALR